MIYPFTGAVGSNMTFNPTLDGQIYGATVTWNAYGQRWYLNLSDLSGNLIIARAITSSDDPKPISSISWSYGVVTANVVTRHFLRLGSVVNLRISGASPDGYNGVYACRITGPSSFEYDLSTNPGQQVAAGNYVGIIDLTQGAFTTSRLVYYENASVFEVFP